MCGTPGRYSSLYFSAECSSPATVTPDSNTPGTQSFTINTGNALLVLDSTLDYEVATSYLIVMTVVDAGTTPDLTGQIVVLVGAPYVMYRQISNISGTKSANLYVSRIVVVFAQSIEAKC